MDTKQIFNIILGQVQPSKQDYKEESVFVSMLMKRIRSVLPSGFSIKLTGSVAKKTFLKNSKDIDIFILVPKRTRKEDFEKLARGIVQKSLGAKPEIRYAEHPYVHIIYGGRHIDIVPAYKISSTREMMSAVDRSVFHTGFVLRRLKKAQIREVLLLKQFLKANGLYGAEIKVEGFSGYLCELLVLKFRNFLGVLKHFSTDKNTKIEFMVKAGKEFFEPLIFVDPVDPSRNVAAVVSEENLKRFRRLCVQFLKKPSRKFFEQDYESEELKRFEKSRYQKYGIFFEKPGIVDDILWGQFKRLGKNLVTFLEKQEFKVKKAILRSSEKCAVFFSVEEGELGSQKIIAGPPLKLKEHVKKFILAHKKAKVIRRGGKASVLVERRIKTVEQAIRVFFKNKQGIPSHFVGLEKKIKKIK
ncbi:CCA tRNA nucleotidyltransferase [Candidatus Micrarchaeota archaeon]|nr:CCA tRNA nucleotidyltransferase [Candidatus Micrarchaeota archaeon]